MNYKQSYLPYPNEIEEFLNNNFINFSEYVNRFKIEDFSLEMDKINEQVQNIENQEMNQSGQEAEQIPDNFIIKIIDYKQTKNAKIDFLKAKTLKEVIRDDDSYYTVNFKYEFSLI